MADLNDTKDIVAELEDLLSKSVEHAKQLPKFMRKLLGTVDEVAILKAEINRLEEEGVEAADKTTDKIKDGMQAQMDVKELVMGQLGFMSAFTSSIQAAVKGAKALGAAFMAHPILAIVAGLALAVLDFARNWTKVRDEMGGTVQQASALAWEIQKAQRSSLLLQFDGKIVRDTAAAIAKEYGTINNVSAKAVKNIAEFAKLNSSSVEDVVKLSKLFDTLSVSAESIRDSIEDMAIDAGILVNVAFKDIADNSEFFAMYTDEGARNIQRAVRFAKQLGLSLDTSAKISAKLLDVETALASQYQIQAVLGQQFNLQEAVRLNFAGQVGAAQEELTKQVQAAVTAAGGWENIKPAQRQVLMEGLDLTGVELMKMVQGASPTGVPRTNIPLEVPATTITDDNTKAITNELKDGFARTENAVQKLQDSNKKVMERLTA